MLDTLQRSTCVEELSAFDMEKYLKKTMSDSSDTSVAHTTFDLTSWADSLSRNLHAEHSKELESSCHEAQSVAQQVLGTQREKDGREATTLNTSSSTVPRSNALSLGNKDESKISSVPPKPLSSARRPVGSVQSSRFKSPADKMEACDNAASLATKTCSSSASTAAEGAVRPGQLNPQSSSNVVSASEAQRGDKISPTSPNVPSRKDSSALAQRVRHTGQQPKQEIPSYSPGKRPSSRNISSAHLPCSSEEKCISFSCQSTNPPRDPACGENDTPIQTTIDQICMCETLV